MAATATIAACVIALAIPSFCPIVATFSTLLMRWPSSSLPAAVRRPGGAASLAPLHLF
jgi:hypothetical protein